MSHGKGAPLLALVALANLDPLPGTGRAFWVRRSRVRCARCGGDIPPGKAGRACAGCRRAGEGTT